MARDYLVPKNWRTFQHYKDRSPPWIRLHKSLLDDFEFQSLPVASRALAPMLWLVASDQTDGKIDADTDRLAFRMRMPKRDLVEALRPLILAGFFEFFGDASSPLAACVQGAVPETETETETEAETEAEVLTHLSADADQPPAFDEFSEAIEIYNSEAVRHDWAKAQRMTPKRAKALRGRLRECGGLDGWREAMRKAGASGFLTGKTGRTAEHANWKPDIDFFLQQQSFTRLMEGKYDGQSTGFKSVSDHLRDWASGASAASNIAAE